jgi:hypothetical protein
MAVSRFDINSGVDRLLFYSGQGHLLGLPTRPGTTSTAGTGVPTNGVAGFAPGAVFYNFLGSPGSCLYVNVGTNLSTVWKNIDSTGANGLVNITGNVTATPVANAGNTNLLNAAAGATVTLPNATGTGNAYNFFVLTSVTSNNYIIQRGRTADVMYGQDFQAGATGAATAFSTAGNSNTITMNGSTTGGLAGDIIELRDVAVNAWRLQMLTKITGTAATPFSNS